MTRQQPATAAGRSLLSDLSNLSDIGVSTDAMRLLILAIEAEAAAPQPVPIYLNGGGSPDFAQIDAYLRAHFNAHAEYNEAAAPLTREQPAEAVALRGADDLFCTMCGKRVRLVHVLPMMHEAVAALANQPAAERLRSICKSCGGTVYREPPKHAPEGNEGYCICGRFRCPEIQPAAERLDAIVRDLASLSSADSPEFRDPGWDDAIRSLIRRARLAAAEQEDK